MQSKSVMTVNQRHPLNISNPKGYIFFVFIFKEKKRNKCVDVTIIHIFPSTSVAPFNDSGLLFVFDLHILVGKKFYCDYLNFFSNQNCIRFFGNF